MAQTGKEEATSAGRSGGVYISNSDNMNISGEMIGRDKITIAPGDPGLAEQFERLIAAIHRADGLADDDKTQLIGEAETLKSELAKPEPRLGVVERVKGLLIERGGAIAAAAAGVFQYPPVQETVTLAVKRLMGA